MATTKHPGRKPAHLVSAGAKPSGRQGIWEAIGVVVQAIDAQRRAA